MAIRQLNFVGLVVKDVAKTTEFYTKTLGLKTIPEMSQPGVFTPFALDGGAMFRRVQRRGGAYHSASRCTRSMLSVASYRPWNAVSIHHLGWMDTESIGKSDEQVEKRPIVYSLSNLRVGPSHLAKGLNLLVGNAVRMARQGTNKLQ